MSPAIPEKKQEGPGKTVMEAPGNHLTEEMICPCCNRPHLKRMVVLECSSCGFRKSESEAKA
jgi:hypothetical protein